MASYNELLALIDAYINQNGVQAITGQVLNGVLRAMVDQLGRGYAIMGAADPTTDPGTPDGPETWFASVPGTYTNFDGIQIVPGELALLSYVPSDGFSKNTIYEGFQTVQATIDGNVGTPAVGVSYANGILSFDFHNMKGNPGNDGAPAGFGTVNATVDDQVGTPSVSVSSSGPDTAKNFTFAFRNLKGETGVTSVLATVDNTSGNPQCAVSLNGQQLVLNFTGLKGAQGDTGSSVDYPFTIVNNLTTNDPAQALSAAMGVQLESEVSQLEAEVDDIAEGRASINLFNKEDLVTGKSISLSAGTLSNRTNGACSAKIPVTGGHYYLLSGRAHQSNSGIRCFDSSNNTMKVRVASTGNEFSNWDFPNEAGDAASDNGQFLVPSTAVTVQFGVKYNATDSIDDIMLTDLGTVYHANPATPEFEPYGATIYTVKESALPADVLEDIAENTSRIDGIIEGIEAEANTPMEVPFMDFGWNMFDKIAEGNVTGKYISAVSGNEVDGLAYTASDYIHLKTGTNYIMPVYEDLYGTSNVKKVAYYGKDKVFIDTVTGTLTDNLLVFSLPSTAYYVRITVANTDLSTFMLVEGTTYPSTYKGHTWKPNAYFDSAGIDEQVIEKLLSFNPLYGKKVCYDGDSIARGGASSSEYGWSPIIAEKNDGTYVSHAVSGGTITNGTYNSGGSARHWICNGIETIYNNGENPDYIIFEGGTNDADVIGSILDQDNIPALFGTWTETDFVGPFDKDTFCGAVEYMFQKALSLFPHTKFGFIIAQKMGANQANSMVRNRKAYFDVIMKICRKWGVPYIDLWDEGFLNPAITSHYNPSLDADGNIEAHSLYRDGQHLTLYGYQVITEKINAWMKTL